MAFLVDHPIRVPKDPADRRVTNDIRKSGFHIVGISEDGDPGRMEYAFTVGCYYSFGIPEVVLHGLDWQTAKEILWDYVKWARKHGPVAAGTLAPDLAEQPLLLRKVDPSWYGPLLGYALWFYEGLDHPFPCLQLAWPDPEGRFDHEEGFQERFRALQPDLSAPCPAP
jgi:hypothetical protein